MNVHNKYEKFKENIYEKLNLWWKYEIETFTNFWILVIFKQKNHKLSNQKFYLLD